jgi:hypothetical protein
MESKEAIYILNLMKDYDYGYDAKEEKEALEYAIQAIKDRRELHKDIYNNNG